MWSGRSVGWSRTRAFGTISSSVRPAPVCWLFQYRRCERCGFTVRLVVREIFDEAAQVKLRLALAHAFARNMGDPE